MANGTETAATPKFLNKNMKLRILSMMMCPAVMLANKRIIKAKGLVKIPINSTGIIIGSNAIGTPGVANICFQ